MRRPALADAAMWGGSPVPRLAGLEGEPIRRIETSPLAAVLLVLLIVFMVLTPAIAGQFSPPRALHLVVMREGRPSVGVDERGRLWWNDGRSWGMGDAAALGRWIASSAVARDGGPVYLRAGTRTRYGHVEAALRAIRSGGVRRVGLIAERPLEAVLLPHDWRR